MQLLAVRSVLRELLGSNGLLLCSVFFHFLFLFKRLFPPQKNAVPHHLIPRHCQSCRSGRPLLQSRRLRLGSGADGGDRRWEGHRDGWEVGHGKGQGLLLQSRTATRGAEPTGIGGGILPCPWAWSRRTETRSWVDIPWCSAGLYTNHWAKPYRNSSSPDRTRSGWSSTTGADPVMQTRNISWSNFYLFRAASFSFYFCLFFPPLSHLI